MAEEWWPSRTEYDPNISKDDWLRLLKDATVFNFNSMCMMHRFLDIGGEATCVELAQKYGRTYSAYISFSIWLATRIQKATKCKMPPAKEKNARLWPILYVGRYVEKNDKHEGVYIWKLRDELKEALNEIDLSKYPLKETNSDWKNLLQKYKQVLQENPKVAFDDEAYKWETITYANEKSWKQILLYLLGKSGETKKASNLFYYSALNNVKSFIENERLDSVMNALCDDNVPLKNRLKQFKGDINDLTSELDKSYARPDDERSASVFLACKNPERYTFYKLSYYESLCIYLGIENESAGEKYEHYLSLIDEFVPLVENDSEIMAFYNERTKNYTHSIRLIAQNIIYVLFESGKNLVNLNKGAPEMTKSEKIIKLLCQKKNIILQGAPGTGKTYSTAEIALSVLGYDVSQYENHKELMDAYNDLLIKIDESSGEITSGQIGFVTFHQSMDYEDFVEGIKPKADEAGNVTYAVEDGIFKAIANKAAKNGEAESGNFEECWKKLIELLNEEEKLSVHTLSGKTTFDIELNEYGDGLASRTYEGNNDDWTRGKSKFFNKKQLENIYKGLPGIPSGGHDNYRKAIIKFMKEDKRIGLSDYKPNENVSAETKPYVLIIDEINRGNVSKIFGELITLLESDKRQGGEHPLSVILPYSKKRFSVPSNLYIIGTMNTTDRSVGNIDYAVRRRFSFVTLESSRKVVSEKCGEESTAVRLFDSVKNFLEKNKIEMDIDDLMVGHSYFLSDDESELEIKWEFDILPLLREYYKDGIIKRDVPKNCKIDDFIKENSESQTE